MKTGIGSATACTFARPKPLLVAVPVPVFNEFSSGQGQGVRAACAASVPLSHWERARVRVTGYPRPPGEGQGVRAICAWYAVKIILPR